MNFNKAYRTWLLARARRHDVKAQKLRKRAKAVTPKRPRKPKLIKDAA